MTACATSCKVVDRRSVGQGIAWQNTNERRAVKKHVEKLARRNSLRELGVDERIILRCMWRKRLVVCWMNTNASVLCAAARLFKRGIEPSGLIRLGISWPAQRLSSYPNGTLPRWVGYFGATRLLSPCLRRATIGLCQTSSVKIFATCFSTTVLILFSHSQVDCQSGHFASSFQIKISQLLACSHCVVHNFIICYILI